MITPEGIDAVCCAACGGAMERKRGDLDMRIDGQLFIIRNVKYQECQTCGERVLEPQDSEEIYERVRTHEYVQETIEVPVVE